MVSQYLLYLRWPDQLLRELQAQARLVRLCVPLRAVPQYYQKQND
jgi:hypothetical protein